MTKPILLRISRVVISVTIFGFMVWYAASSDHPPSGDHLWKAWIVTMILLIFFCAAIGQWLMDSPLGILVSNFNLMSLSCIQLVAWTIVILSGHFVILMARIGHGVPPLNALDVNVPNNLWGVLGIGTASFAAVPIVLDSKTRNTVDPQAIRTASLVLKEDAGAIQQNAKGTVYANSKPSDARFSDLFQGDEIGNTAYVDISKLQLFLLTLFVIVAYCHLLGAAMLAGVSPKDFAGLPDFSPGELKLLGLSHAGYLTFKAVNHTPDTPTTRQS
jgi:hypothetical protein